MPTNSTNSTKSSNTTLLQTLGRFADDIARNGLAPEVVADVKGRVLDVVGNMAAAHGSPEGDGPAPGTIVQELVGSWGGSAQAHAIGLTDAVPAVSAALVNGTLAHALDFDDTHLPSVLHPSASIVPAALAVAQMIGASGSAMIAAIAVGDEICNRIGMASYRQEIANSVFFEHGLHATSICGTIGAAATATMLLGGDAEAITNAMAIACSMGSGIIEANRTGGTVKRIHCGWAAHGGITAAQMAFAGLTGPPTGLEGRFGLFEALSRSFLNEQAITEGLGSRWELLRTFYKPYPSNHFTHAGIDAAMAMRADGLDPADIASVELGVPAPTVRSIGEPYEDKIRPKSGYHGKFSGPFTVATAFTGGGGLGVYLDDFTDAKLHDETFMSLVGKVRVMADDQCTAIFPHQFPAVLRVITKGGTTIERRVNVNRGGPENPLSGDELALKFRSNASRSLDSGAVSSIEQVIRSLDTVSKIDSTLTPNCA
jgi:2-methylcitrate dehydratase PrpD